MLLPLFNIERWLRQAALGREVVPDVNCMLTISSGWRSSFGKGYGDLPSKRM